MRSLRRFLLLGGLIVSLVDPALAERSTLDRCVSSIAGSVFRLYDRAGRCIRSCEDQKQRGKLSSDTSCSPSSNHGPTQTCLLRAMEHVTGSKSTARRVCTDREIDLLYGNSFTCFGRNDNIDDLLACLQEEAFFELDRQARQIFDPFAVDFEICGDGRITGFEECDPNLSGSTCSLDQVCHPDFCFCTFRGCGNGIIEFGEDCDPNAFPSGCSSDAFCNFNCDCQRVGSASQAFLVPSANLID